MGDGRTDDVSDVDDVSARLAEPGMPRWVKGFVLAVVVVVALFVALLVLGGGGHGPQRHSGAGAGAVGVVPLAVALSSYAA